MSLWPVCQRNATYAGSTCLGSVHGHGHGFEGAHCYCVLAPRLHLRLQPLGVLALLSLRGPHPHGIGPVPPARQGAAMHANGGDVDTAV